MPAPSAKKEQDVSTIPLPALPATADLPTPEENEYYDPGFWFGLVSSLQKQLNALPRDHWDRTDEDDARFRDLSRQHAHAMAVGRRMFDDPPRRPLRDFPGCPAARGCGRMQYWAGIWDGRDYLGYARWGKTGGLPDPGGSHWQRHALRVERGWWKQYRAVMAEEVYQAGRRELDGAHWTPSDDDLEWVDDQIHYWAACGYAVDGRAIERFVVDFLDLQPATAVEARSPLAIESADPWTAHLLWVQEWSEGKPFTVTAMLNALARDPAAPPVPGEKVDLDGPGAARTVGIRYGLQREAHAGLVLRGTGSAHNTRAWQVVAE